MKKIILGLPVLFMNVSEAAIVHVQHDIVNLPSSGYLEIDLDKDGSNDINLASNFYISSWQGTQFVRSYSLLNAVINNNLSWTGGNDWPDPKGYVQDDYLYLAIRNTTIGPYYGYLTYNYHAQTNSVSLRSFTYDNTGAAITVAAPVPEPTSLCLLGSGLVFLFGMARRRN